MSKQEPVKRVPAPAGDLSATRELGARDLALLRHIGLYRLTIKETAAAALGFENAPRAGTALSALERYGFLSSGTLPGDHRFFTLSARGAALAGVPKERGEPLGSAALSTHLSVLWFCTLSERRRYRLEPEELRELFAADAPFHNIPHLVSDELAGRCILRVCEASGQAGHAIRSIRQHLHRAGEKPKLHSAMQAGAYRLLVLAETPEKCQHLNMLLKRDDEDDTRSLSNVAVRHAPSVRTLSEALAQLKPKATA